MYAQKIEIPNRAATRATRWALVRRELTAPGFAREFLLFLSVACGGAASALLLLVALAGEGAHG